MLPKKLKKTQESISHNKQLKTGYLNIKTKIKNLKTVIQDITFLMSSGLKSKAYGITDSLYSTANKILLLLMKYTLKRILRTYRNFYGKIQGIKTKSA